MADFQSIIDGVSTSFDILLDFVLELFPIVIFFGVIIGVAGYMKLKKG